MDRKTLLSKVESAWTAFNQSYSGLKDVALAEPGVVGEWSVKDIIAHVAVWEEETMKALPVLIAGKRTPGYNGIDRFNLEQHNRNAGLSMKQVTARSIETHRRLLAYLMTVPEHQFTRENRVRRRLRLDTYRHYPEHTSSILDWRRRRGL